MTLRTITGRIGVDASADDLAWPAHDARASLPYSFDFGPLLEDLEKQIGAPAKSISITTAEARHSTDAALVVLPATISADGRIVTVLIAGGTPGGTVQVGILPTLSDGYVLDPVSISLAVVNRMAGLDLVLPDGSITSGGAPLVVNGSVVEISTLGPLPGGATPGDGLLAYRPGQNGAPGKLGFLPPGSGGGGGVVTDYVFQQAAPSATWTITHNLGRRPAVRVLTTSGDLVDTAASYPDANTVVLTFAAPFAGTAYL